MSAEEGGRRGAAAEDLGDEEAEFAVADDRDAVRLADDALFDDAERGGERFGEGGVLRRHAVGDDVQVRRGKRQPLRVAPVLAEDPEDAPTRAVIPPSRPAPRARLAVPTGQVDLAHYPLLRQRLVPCGGFFAHPDEFVTHDPREPHVALHDLQVRVADPRDQDADQSLPGTRPGDRALLHGRPRALHHESLHRLDVWAAHAAVESLGGGGLAARPAGPTKGAARALEPLRGERRRRDLPKG
mmetsp:Transcript_21704/g.67978  ORF Transcript_21704/g.67978 Transcript_21704/m.67978 type:complete len:242 (+) Transcript_21704:450-1175(+)